MRARPLGGFVIPHVVGAAVVAISAATAATALLEAVYALPEAGVYVEVAGSTIEAVVPGSPTWSLDIRPGDLVLLLDPGESPSDWRLSVRNPRGEVIDAPMSAMTGMLRHEIPVAVLAIGCALWGAVRIRRAPAEAAAFGVAAAVLAQAPLVAAGNVPAVSGALAYAALAPATWLAVWAPKRWVVPCRVWLLASALGVVGWLAAHHLLPAAYDVAESTRAIDAFGGLVVVAAVLVRVQHWHPIRAVGSRVIIELSALAAVVAYLVLAANQPDWLTGLIVAVIVVLYPRSRDALSGAADRVFFGEMRGRAAIAAAEDERGRLARDLHDVPLQELAAVIRGLDAHPEARAEARLVRDVAEHLRRVTTELRPPVLDDLGLAAALAFLVAHVARPERVDIALELDDRAGVRTADRPPAAIEVAVFRIIQEALTNALVHSGGSHVRVTGLVERGRIELVVIDDGRGIGTPALHEARRQGHLGMYSMEQRAATIGARLTVETLAPGTAIRVRWAIR